MWTKYTGIPNIPNYSQCLVAINKKNGERLLLVGTVIKENCGIVIHSAVSGCIVRLDDTSPEFYYHILDERLQVNESSILIPLCMNEPEPENSLDLWPKP